MLLSNPTPRDQIVDFARKMERELTDVRAALGDDGRRTHKEILEMASKASGWREWKQKYIDLRNAHIAEGQDPAGTIWEHADKLQRELKASQDEVERFRKEIAFREELDAVAAEVWDELKAENANLRELLSNLCSALLHRMVGDEPTGQEVIALLNAYRAADEFLKPNSLQPKPLTASHS